MNRLFVSSCRKVAPVLILPLLAFSLPVTATAEATVKRLHQDRTLSVSGEGKVHVPITRARIQFAVEAQKETPQEAQQTVAEGSSRLVAFLRQQDIEQLQTSGVSLQPVFENRRTREGHYSRHIVGYHATNSVTFSVPIENAGRLLDEGVRQGASRINSFQLTASDAAMVEARKEALRKASRQALETGDAVLEAFGFTRQAISHIQVDPSPPMIPFRGMRTMEAMDAAHVTEIEGGEQEVVASVSLTIRY